MESRSGLPISEVFPADSVVARFVVSMSMARNDMVRALADVEGAAKAGADPEWNLMYRTRLLVGHYVEALNALKSYEDHHADVARLLGRVPLAARKQLTAARGAVNSADVRGTKHLRNTAFHYPSPASSYQPTSDEQLGHALNAMQHRPAGVKLTSGKGILLTFADQVATSLALTPPGTKAKMPDLATLGQGTVEFISWVDALVLRYLQDEGLEFDEGVPDPEG